jgi:hypothetical protein
MTVALPGPSSRDAAGPAAGPRPPWRALPAEAGPLPWLAEAILWLPGEPPCFGRERITERLAAGPATLPQPAGAAIDLAPGEDHALERGAGTLAGARFGYLRLWRRGRGGEWWVVREVWDGARELGM